MQTQETSVEAQAEKQITQSNQLWFMKDGELTKIGFTTSFLEVVRECWHVTPVHRVEAKENSPLLSIESDDSLFAISSPVSGSIVDFNQKASNFPDKLTEDDVVMIIGPKRKAKAVKTVAEQSLADLDSMRIPTPPRSNALSGAQWVSFNAGADIPVPAEPLPEQPPMTHSEMLRQILRQQEESRAAQARPTNRPSNRNPR